MMTSGSTEARLYSTNKNGGYKASLEVGKPYQFIADEAAEGEGMIRLIDESGDDYLFESERFYPVELPPALAKESRRVY